MKTYARLFCTKNDCRVSMSKWHVSIHAIQRLGAMTIGPFIEIGSPMQDVDEWKATLQRIWIGVAHHLWRSSTWHGLNWSNLLTATSWGFLLILGSAVNNYQQVSLVGTSWNIKLVECFQLPNTNSLCVCIYLYTYSYYIERWCHLAVPDPTALGSRRIDVAKCLV